MDALPGTLIVAAIVGTAGFVVARWVMDLVIQKRVFGPAVRDLEQTLPRLQREVLQYRDVPRAEQVARSARILAMITRANTNLRALDGPRRQRYEMRISEIRGLAAGSGIPWTATGPLATGSRGRRIA